MSRPRRRASPRSSSCWPRCRSTSRASGCRPALFAMAAMIAAIGLSLLVGIAGQLSLGARVLRRDRRLRLRVPRRQRSASRRCCALRRAPSLLAGLAGALFSPIAGRVRGIYLGLASLGLVFLGQHILQNATGDHRRLRRASRSRRSACSASASRTPSPDSLVILGVPFGALERLWYLGVVLVAVAIWYGRNLVRSRPGRALGDAARQRGRGRGDGRRRRPLQGGGVHACRRCTRASAAC